MPITKLFTDSQLKQYLQKNIEGYKGNLLDLFKIHGEMAVRIMRTNSEAGNKKLFTDRTANLRNSEGYLIFKDRNIVVDTYPNNAKPNPNISESERSKVGQGVRMGKRLAQGIGSEFAPKNGFLLIATAGMDYALYVEAKGYDVITGGAIKVKKELDKAMQKLHNKVTKLSRR